MTRNIKALGLALMAAFALAAVAAPVASAQYFHSEESHTFVDGVQKEVNTFNVNAGTIYCRIATFRGTASAATVEQITVDPFYDECFLADGVNLYVATVDMNRCDYLLTSTTRPTHVQCEGTDLIRITAPLCHVTVAPQTVNGVHYSNQGAEKTRAILVTALVTGIKYTQSALCPNGGGGTFENGTYKGTVLATGTDTGSNQVGIWAD